MHHLGYVFQQFWNDDEELPQSASAGEPRRQVAVRQDRQPRRSSGLVVTAF